MNIEQFRHDMIEAMARQGLSFSAIPPVYLKISPYLITLVVLIFSSKNTSAPRAEGKFFEYKK